MATLTRTTFRPSAWRLRVLQRDNNDWLTERLSDGDTVADVQGMFRQETGQQLRVYKRWTELCVYWPEEERYLDAQEIDAVISMVER